MSDFVFVTPAHGRQRLTAVCLRQLARTCERLRAEGHTAGAVIVADEEPTLELALELGFVTVEQENAPLGRKFNDGYQAAADPAINSTPAEFVIPFGSDNWIDPELLLSAPLPDADSITCFRLAAFVREDAYELARIKVRYRGGLGIRIIPAALLERVGYRPVSEERMRAIDASSLQNLEAATRLRLVYHDLHPLQIVDWKSSTEQLNPFRSCLPHSQGRQERPFEALLGIYPDDALEECVDLYLEAAR